ncbi:hypothetical protein CW703_04665 [Candidatus Bathyarchaeota archaeon]|nr:MAG: hypothetical protein CW703_04665 [Candidatus Bathyarchaeota archaeon]
MPKFPGVLILMIVLIYGWQLAWIFAETMDPNLPAYLVGGIPFALWYGMILGTIVLGGALGAFSAWYFSKKEEEMLKMMEKKEGE